MNGTGESGEFASRKHGYEMERWVESVLSSVGYTCIEHVGGLSAMAENRARDYFATQGDGRRVPLEVKCASLSVKDEHPSRHGPRKRGSWRIHKDNLDLLCADRGTFIFILHVKKSPVAVFAASAEWVRKRFTGRG